MTAAGTYGGVQACACSSRQRPVAVGLVARFGFTDWCLHLPASAVKQRRSSVQQRFHQIVRPSAGRSLAYHLKHAVRVSLS